MSAISKALNAQVGNLLKLDKELDELDFKVSAQEYNTKLAEMKKAIINLYDKDNKFELFTKRSVLILLRLNLKYRAVLLHSFGLFIDLKEL